jgi:tRNA threonylcarbamoyladenosine biosynthesis protein TsaB
MTVLAVDTSTNRGSIVLLRDAVVLLEELFPADRSQSSELFPMLERARALSPQFDLIAVGLGPGSYAGVRITIAAALGLSCATGAQLVGVPSVAALETEAQRYIAIGDARRDTFYFTRVDDGACAEGPLLLNAEELQSKLASHPELPVFSPAPVPSIARATVALPLAKILARLASAARSIVQRDNLEPLYLRDPHITTPKARLPL